MDLVHTIVSIVLAFLCATSALADFRGVPQILQTMERLRMPVRIVPALGVAKTAAAGGLLLGLGIERLGTFTAFCLSVYFVFAVGAHLRVRDALVETIPALVMLGLAVATFVLSL